ncbi:MAG: hypothetical protein LBL90_09885 [Prevotellaceae bacterium]|jgi:hypothetical protein|nr:hypothetical protein [Prevotellaceae bacterium]
MKIAETKIREILQSVYPYTILDNNSLSPYPLILLPDKQLAFHIISIDKNSGNEFLFYNLSNSYLACGIRLIQLWEDFLVNKQAIVESRIKLLLGSFTRIHARQTRVERIDKHLSDKFLNDNNLYGSPTAKYRYGLYLDNTLLAVASFSAIRSYWRDGIPYRSAELVRFANLNGYSVAGGLSKLLVHFIREQKPDDVMSYADRDWSIGTSYEELGFQKIEYTMPQMFWIHPDELIRYYPRRLPHSIIENFQAQNEIKIMDDYLLSKGYLKIFNVGNIKYILNLKKLNG